MDVTVAQWRKSSYSEEGQNGNCVEVAVLSDGRVAVRDTKDRSLPPHVQSATAWAAFVAGVRAGDFGQG